MPKPKPGESKSSYLDRCIPIVMKEGATKDQAIGKCNGMWASSKREESVDQLEYRMLEVRGGTLNKEERSVECLISTESPVPMFDWDRGEVVDEILLTDGAVLPRSRQVPLLNTHMRHSLEDVLGSARSVKKTDDGVIGRLQFSSLAQEQFTRVEEGHITDVSAGYRVDEKEFVPKGERHKINNRFFSGPVNVVTKWHLREVSLVPIGADDQAKLRGLQITPVVSPETNLTGDKKMDETRTETKTEPAEKIEPVEVAGSPGNRKEEINIEELVSRAVSKAVPEIIDFQREQEKKFRAECDAILEIADLQSNRALVELCYSCKDMPAVRKAILEHRQKGTVDVGPAFQFRAGDHTATEKFNGCMGTAMLMRSLNNDEKLLEKVCNSEYEYGRQNVFGSPETWQQRKDRSKGWEQYRTMSLLQIASECLRFEGVDTRYLQNWQIAQGALGFYREAGIRSQHWDSSLSMRNPGMPAYHVTGSFANLTLDAINKTLLGGYVERPFTWEGPMRRAPSAKDFKRIYRVRLGEFPNLEVVPDNKAPNQASFADEKESYAVEAYAKEVSFSWQLLVNDDMDALSRTPRMMGTAAARTVNAVAWALVESNANLQDSQPWFSTATGNRKKDNLISSGSGSPNLARLQAMRKLMRLQVGVNTPEQAASEAILNLEPSYYVVPAALELVARQIMFSPFSPDATNSITFNQFNQGNSGWTLVVEPLLDSQTNGTTASMLFCSPSQCDTAEVTFLQGQEMPMTRSYIDNPTMAMNLQVWQTFGAKAIDFRGVVRDKGIP